MCWPVLALGPHPQALHHNKWDTDTFVAKLQIRDLSSLKQRREHVRPVDRHERFFFRPCGFGVGPSSNARETLARATSPELPGAFPRTGKPFFFKKKNLVHHDAFTSAVACFPVRLNHLDVWRRAWTVWLSRSVLSSPGGLPTWKFLAARHGQCHRSDKQSTCRPFQ